MLNSAGDMSIWSLCSQAGRTQNEMIKKVALGHEFIHMTYLISTACTGRVLEVYNRAFYMAGELLT